MNTDSFVSVIVPCYHSEKYIDRCCTSIAMQTHDNLEAIFVIDDIRHDRTVDIIKSFGDARFIICGSTGKTNCASARNRGFRLSRGDYIIFLDSDDWMAGDRIYDQVSVLQEHIGIDWVSSQVCQVFDGFWPAAIITNHPGSSHIPCGITSVMFTRNFLEQVIIRDGYLFDTSLSRYDDYDLVLRIRGGNSMMIEKPLVFLYSNPDGLSQSESQFAGGMKLYRIVLKNLKHSRDIIIPWTISILKSPFAGGWK